MAYTPTLLVTSGTGVDTVKAAGDKINTNLNNIATEIENVRISVVEWTNSVVSKDSSAPPVSPTEGDRYIVKATGTGDWAGHDTEIAEYDGEDWVFTEPVTGTATVVDDETIIYVFNGTAWVASEGAPHELSHLSGGTDEIDGDKLDIDYTAVNYTAATASGITDATTQLTSHIKGLDTAVGGKQASLGYTAENAANKDTDGTLASDSDTKYPSQKAVKTYVTTGLGTKAASSHTHASGDLTDATSTPTASKIPIADGSGKLAAGWGGGASTLATLNSSTLVVQDPASASVESAAAKIPIADADGTVDNFVSPEYIDINADLLEIEYIPATYTRTLSPSASAINQIASHLKGIDDKLAAIEAVIAAL